YVKWYVDVYVNDTQGNPVDNATVLAWDNNNVLTFTENTNSSGYIERQNVTEYYQNSTGKFFFTNYSVKASKNPQSPVEEINLTTNMLVNLTLDLNAPSIYFVSPTPANNTKKKSIENFVYVNVTVEETNEHSAYLDWNRSLRGYWKFDESLGATADDNSTWNNDGSLNGDANWTVFSKRGNALTLDGNGDFVNLSESASLNITDAITIEVWIYARSFNWISGIIGDVYDTLSPWDLRLGDDDPQKPEWIVCNYDTCNELVGSTALQANTWYHVVSTYNGSVSKIYINGVEDASANVSFSSLAPQGNSLGIEIGRDATDNTRILNGTIDELKVWSRALSPQEINASYNNGLYRLERNFTNLSGGVYEYYACVEDEAGNSNCTETRLLKINRLPTAPELIAPENGTHIYNRTPLFNWTASSDEDGDSLQYVWILHCDSSGLGESCSPVDERTIENLTATNYTPETVLKNFWDTQEYYLWKVKAWDGLEYGSESSIWELYIDSLVALSTINATADFGEMAPGTVNDTTDNTPWPLSIQNDGNCFVNVSIFGTQLWNATPYISDTYQYKFDYLELNSFNWSESVVNWGNVPIDFTILGVLSKFNYTDTNDSAELDIRVAPYDYEPPGAKNSTITLTGQFQDVQE
ncbi:MAG: LamG domain-containing protein, partial [Candidatus Pacearchaeota archaeon]